MSNIIKKLGFFIVLLGAISGFFGIQEIVLSKSDFLKSSLSNFINEKLTKRNIIINEESFETGVKKIESDYLYSGIRHIFYALCFIFSGIGFIKRQKWGKTLFLATWIIIFLFSMYFVIKGTSFKYMLIPSLVIFILSLYFFNKTNIKEQLWK